MLTFTDGTIKLIFNLADENNYHWRVEHTKLNTGTYIPKHEFMTLYANVRTGKQSPTYSSIVNVLEELAA